MGTPKMTLKTACATIKRFQILAWINIPIPGTRRCQYLEENAAAADVTLYADD